MHCTCDQWRRNRPKKVIKLKSEDTGLRGWSHEWNTANLVYRECEDGTVDVRKDRWGTAGLITKERFASLLKYHSEMENARGFGAPYLFCPWCGNRLKDEEQPDTMTWTCAWSEDADGNWWSDCENGHIFSDGGPAGNGFKACPYCGRPLVEKPYAEPEAEPDGEPYPDQK